MVNNILPGMAVYRIKKMNKIKLIIMLLKLIKKNANIFKHINNNLKGLIMLNDENLKKLFKWCGENAWVVFLGFMGAVCTGPGFLISLKFYVLVIGVILLHHFRDKIRDKVRNIEI